MPKTLPCFQWHRPRTPEERAVDGGWGFRWAVKSAKSTAAHPLGQKSRALFYGSNMIRPPGPCKDYNRSVFRWLARRHRPSYQPFNGAFSITVNSRPQTKSLPCARGGGPKGRRGCRFPVTYNPPVSKLTAPFTQGGLSRARGRKETPLSRLRRQLPPKGSLGCARHGRGRGTGFAETYKKAPFQASPCGGGGKKALRNLFDGEGMFPRPVRRRKASPVQGEVARRAGGVVAFRSHTIPQSAS